MKADRIFKSAASVLEAVTFAMSTAAAEPSGAQMPNMIWMAGLPRIRLDK